MASSKIKNPPAILDTIPENVPEILESIPEDPQVLKGGIEYNKEATQKNKWWHPLLTALPVGGAILGGLAGAPTGGLASIGLAGVGAAGGEELKQIIELMTNQRDEANWGEVGKQGVFGSLSELGGQAIGKGFEFAQPKIAEALAGIPKEDYLRVLSNLKSGGKGFKKDALKTAGKNIGRVVNEAEQSTELGYLPLKEQLENVIKGYGHNVNPAAEKAAPHINQLMNALEQSNISNISGDNAEIIAALKDIGIDNIGNPNLQIPDKVSFKDMHLIKQSLQDASKYGDYKGQPNELVKDLAKVLNKNLREASPEYKLANEKFQDALAESSFSDAAPKYLTHWLGRNAGKAGLGTAIGALGGSAMLHANPAVLASEGAVMAQMSPLVQKQLLKLYVASHKSKLGGGIGSIFGKLISADQSAYETSLNGEIPAEQFRNRR
jgi:hypothetical protein